MNQIDILKMESIVNQEMARPKSIVKIKEKPDVIKMFDNYLEMEKMLERDSRNALVETLKDRSDSWIKGAIKTMSKSIDDYIENESEHGIAISMAKHVIWYKWELSNRKDKK